MAKTSNIHCLCWGGCCRAEHALRQVAFQINASSRALQGGGPAVAPFCAECLHDFIQLTSCVFPCSQLCEECHLALPLWCSPESVHPPCSCQTWYLSSCA